MSVCIEAPNISDMETDNCRNRISLTPHQPYPNLTRGYGRSTDMCPYQGPNPTRVKARKFGPIEYRYVGWRTGRTGRLVGPELSLWPVLGRLAQGTENGPWIVGLVGPKGILDIFGWPINQKRRQTILFHAFVVVSE